MTEVGSLNCNWTATGRGEQADRFARALRMLRFEAISAIAAALGVAADINIRNGDLTFV